MIKANEKSYFIFDIEGDQVVLEWFVVANFFGMNIHDSYAFFRTIATRILELEQLAGVGKIQKIVFNGVEYRYEGWKPNREYTFVNINDQQDTYSVFLD